MATRLRRCTFARSVAAVVLASATLTCLPGAPGARPARAQANEEAQPHQAGGKGWSRSGTLKLVGKKPGDASYEVYPIPVGNSDYDENTHTWSDALPPGNGTLPPHPATSGPTELGIEYQGKFPGDFGSCHYAQRQFKWAYHERMMAHITVGRGEEERVWADAGVYVYCSRPIPGPALAETNCSSRNSAWTFNFPSITEGLFSIAGPSLNCQSMGTQDKDSNPSDQWNGVLERDGQQKTEHAADPEDVARFSVDVATMASCSCCGGTNSHAAAQVQVEYLICSGLHQVPQVPCDSDSKNLPDYTQAYSFEN